MPCRAMQKFKTKKGDRFSCDRLEPVWLTALALIVEPAELLKPASSAPFAHRFPEGLGRLTVAILAFT